MYTSLFLVPVVRCDKCGRFKIYEGEIDIITHNQKQAYNQIPEEYKCTCGEHV